LTPYYQHAGITIYCADNRDVLPTLEKFDLVLTDPPWGNDTACNAQRFTRPSSPWWKEVDNTKVKAHKQIEGDKSEFDPRPWIKQPAILWGANHFTRHLPHSGGWFVWDKRSGAEDLAEKGWPLGEAELAWTNVIGATRVFRNLWVGLLRNQERGEFYHPTQKPVALMRWCFQFCHGEVTLDPYMGSGSTLVAAKMLGRRAIGIEIEERYCEIAAKRLIQEVLPLHEAETIAPRQLSLMGDV
jgi:DNA modification methylase